MYRHCLKWIKLAEGIFQEIPFPVHCLDTGYPDCYMFVVFPSTARQIQEECPKLDCHGSSRPSPMQSMEAVYLADVARLQP
jgi:hypothetical protein